MRSVDVFIVGAQKAGTTSLKSYLGQHLGVKTHEHTEFTYFSDDVEYDTGYEKSYFKYFSSDDRNQPLLLAKNVTMSFREHCLERLKKHNPECKLIYVLRNPIDRAYSSYQMACRNGWMQEDFDYLRTAIENNRQGKYDKFYRFFIELGIYDYQYDLILKYFPSDQVKIVLFEKLKKDATIVCQDIFSFLKVANDFVPYTEEKHNTGNLRRFNSYTILLKKLRQLNFIKELVRRILSEKLFIRLVDFLQKLNVSKKSYEIMTDNDRQVLSRFYFEYNESLSEKIGVDLNEFWGIS